MVCSQNSCVAHSEIMIIVREAKPKDSAALSKLNLAYNGKPAISPAKIARHLARNKHEKTFVVLQDKNIVGFACVLTTQSWCYTWEHFYLAEMYVAPDSRRKGIGRELMEYLEKYARKHKYHELKLSVDWKNIPAKKLYLSQGFTKKGGIELLKYPKY